jgi:hypothetical protein
MRDGNTRHDTRHVSNRMGYRQRIVRRHVNEQIPAGPRGVELVNDEGWQRVESGGLLVGQCATIKSENAVSETEGNCQSGGFRREFGVAVGQPRLSSREALGFYRCDFHHSGESVGGARVGEAKGGENSVRLHRRSDSGLVGSEEWFRRRPDCGFAFN